MENNNTLEIAVEESQRRRSDLIADRLHEINGSKKEVYHLPVMDQKPSLPRVINILCTDEAGMLVQISYDESTKVTREVRRYQGPADVRADVESILNRYNINKGSSISIDYRVPKDVVGYHALPSTMISFVDGVTKKYES